MAPGEKPVVIGDARRIVPRTDIFRTCERQDCNKVDPIKTPLIPDIKDCRKDNNCDIITIFEPPKKDKELTCPEIELRAVPYTSRLDILFVVDTSASMKQERGIIADQMEKFINELSPDVKYRVGVLLGHGPNSNAKNVKIGELYGSGQGDGLVIMQDEMLKAFERDGNKSKEEARAAAARMVIQKLKTKMLSVPNDTSPAEGEALLTNLYTAVALKKHLLNQANFWEDDAAKVVIFVADENDVCYDYKGENERLAAELKKMGREFKPFSPNIDPKSNYKATEEAAFNAGDICANVIKGSKTRVTPAGVLEGVLANSGKNPVAITGILYINNSFTPKPKTNPDGSYGWSGDNEMGRGLLDIISLHHGQAADLDSKDFGSMLAKIGDFANFRMKYDHIFPMRGVRDVKDIDPATIRVEITSPNGRKDTFVPTAVDLEIDEKKNEARVVIGYKTLEAVYTDGMVVKGSKIIIRYSTKSGIGPVEMPAAPAKPVEQPAPVVSQPAPTPAVPSAPVVTPAPIEPQPVAAPPVPYRYTPTPEPEEPRDFGTKREETQAP
jgi:hypothetical protein